MTTKRKLLGQLKFIGAPLSLKNSRDILRNPKTGAIRFANKKFLSSIDDWGVQLMAQRQFFMANFPEGQKHLSLAYNAGLLRPTLPIVVSRATNIRLRVTYWLTPKQTTSDASMPDFDNVYTATVDMMKKIGVLSDDRFLLCPVETSEPAGVDPHGLTIVELYTCPEYAWKV